MSSAFAQSVLQHPRTQAENDLALAVLRLRRTVQDLRQSFIAGRNTERQMAAEIRGLDGQYNQANARVGQLQNELVEWKVRHRDLQRDFHKAMADMQQFQQREAQLHKLLTSSEDQVEALKTDVKDAIDRGDQTSGRLRGALEQLDTLNAENGQLHNALDAMRQDNVMGMYEAQIAALKKQIQELKDNGDAQEKVGIELAEGLEEVRGYASDCEARIDRQEKALEDANTNLADAKTREDALLETQATIIAERDAALAEVKYLTNNSRYVSLTGHTSDEARKHLLFQYGIVLTQDDHDSEANDLRMKNVQLMEENQELQNEVRRLSSQVPDLGKIMGVELLQKGKENSWARARNNLPELQEALNKIAGDKNEFRRQLVLDFGQVRIQKPSAAALKGMTAFGLAEPKKTSPEALIGLTAFAKALAEVDKDSETTDSENSDYESASDCCPKTIHDNLPVYDDTASVKDSEYPTHYDDSEYPDSCCEGAVRLGDTAIASKVGDKVAENETDEGGVAVTDEGHLFERDNVAEWIEDVAASGVISTSPDPFRDIDTSNNDNTEVEMPTMNADGSLAITVVDQAPDSDGASDANPTTALNSQSPADFEDVSLASSPASSDNGVVDVDWNLVEYISASEASDPISEFSELSAPSTDKAEQW